jgi:hypothetical protein
MWPTVRAAASSDDKYVNCKYAMGTNVIVVEILGLSVTGATNLRPVHMLEDAEL